jgi:hypothetical protein
MSRGSLRGDKCARWLVAVFLATMILPAGNLWSEEPKAAEGVAVVRNESLAEHKIRSALSDPTTLEFIETPLKDVVDYLKDLHGIEIQIDAKALDGVGVSTDTPITRNLKGVSLRSALKLILPDLDLTFVVRNDVLQITTPEMVERDVTVRIHHAADLLSDEASAKALVTAVEMALDASLPTSDAEKPPPTSSRVTFFRNILLVRGNPHEHERVSTLLGEIRQALKLPAPKVAHLLEDLKLGRIADLRRLHLKASDLAELRDRSRVRELRLDFNELGREGLLSLEGFEKVEVLSLRSNRLDDKHGEFLTGLSVLKELDLAENHLTDKGVVQLKEAQKLRHLTLQANPVGDAALATLAQLKQMEWLNLSSTAVTSKGLAHLKSLEKLQGLSLANTRVENLRELPSLPALLQLDLSNTPIKDPDLDRIGKLGKLSRLNLSGSEISDMGLLQLANMKNLRLLAIGNSSTRFVSSEGIRKLREALPQCQIETSGAPWPMRLMSTEPDPFGAADPFGRTPAPSDDDPFR